MPRFLKARSSALIGVGVLHRDQVVEELDDRDLDAEVAKIDANSQPITPPPSTTRRFGTSVIGEQAGGVDAARVVDAVDRRPRRATSPSR